MPGARNAVIEPILICTDLDRTLLPNGAAPESQAARGRFAAVASRPEVSLAYVTGRHRALVEEAIEQYSLPLPQFMIGDVGTTIYELEGDVWRLSSSWSSELTTVWTPAIRAELARRLREIPELRPQEESKQGEFKLSFYTPSGVEPEGWRGEVERRLAELGSEVRLVSSLDETSREGLLDVLPRQAGKLPAMEFLIQQLGMRRTRTLFAGDSGNDMEVLTSNIPAVLVLNAAEEIRRQAQMEAADRGNTE